MMSSHRGNEKIGRKRQPRDDQLAVPACGGAEKDVHPRRGIKGHVKDKEDRSRLASDKRAWAAATSSLTRMHPVAAPGNAGMWECDVE
jgi:hypothetical protein